MDRKKEGLIPFIQKRAGVAFERIGAPQPAEMARIAGELPARAHAASCRPPSQLVLWLDLAMHVLRAVMCCVRVMCG